MSSERESPYGHHLEVLHDLVETASNGETFNNGLNGLVLALPGDMTVWRADDGSAITVPDVDTPSGVADCPTVTVTVHLSASGGFRAVHIGEGTEQRQVSAGARLTLIAAAANQAIALFSNGQEE